MTTDSEYCESVPPRPSVPVTGGSEPASFDTGDETIRGNHYDAVGCVEPGGDAGGGGREGSTGSRSPEAVAAAVRADATRIRDRQVTEAIDRLDAAGELGDAQRDAVEELAEALVEGVIGDAVEYLRTGADRPTARTAARLFDAEFDERGGADRADGSDGAPGSESAPAPAPGPDSPGGER